MKTHQIVSFQAGVVYSVNFHRLENIQAVIWRLSHFTGSLSLEFWISRGSALRADDVTVFNPVAIYESYSSIPNRLSDDCAQALFRDDGLSCPRFSCSHMLLSLLSRN